MDTDSLIKLNKLYMYALLGTADTKNMQKSLCKVFFCKIISFISLFSSIYLKNVNHWLIIDNYWIINLFLLSQSEIPFRNKHVVSPGLK